MMGIAKNISKNQVFFSFIFMYPDCAIIITTNKQKMISLSYQRLEKSSFSHTTVFSSFINNEGILGIFLIL